MRMPKQKPGRSRQDYETPRELFSAVERRFGPFVFDLAASSRNSKCNEYYNSRVDSLKQDWSQLRGNLWLNPPFANIDPWAAKCKLSRINLAVLEHKAGQYQSPAATCIFLLTPASVGSNWFMEHVWGHALVLALNPRLTFVGETAPYPKDCILSVYGMTPGFEIWRWK